MRCFILIATLTSFLSFNAQAAHVYSQFETGLGQWQADGVRHVERQLSTNASLVLGLDAGHRAPFTFLKADSTRLMNVPYQGTGPDSDLRRHEIEGLGLGFGWRTQRYMGWAGYSGGRWRVVGRLGGVDRFAYRSPFAGFGIRIYQSSIASILMLYQVSRLEPEPAWLNEYGLKNPWLQSLTIAIQLRSQD